MIAFVRVVLLLVPSAMLVGALGGIFAASTGILEKAVLAAGGAFVLLAASRVQRLGSRPSA